ncbi:MAG TPA: type IV pilus twitching motility protein PilT [Candidatus Marinimicrobia bacterium]|jgi:twitching motility protein PilT|nr:type IV pilus twitching motility protein PilT [Candidatus Neomarinimicrobiota bacterium]|tara:strand:- start:131 stop:1183 length:1053 start_codon:yes stop_codon:yes gene_type:complete
MKIDELLNYALDSGASDLHLSVGSKPMVRINGTMHPLNLEIMTKELMESILPQVLSDEQVSKFRKEKEIDFSAKMDGKGRFRVNFFSQLNGIAGVFRTIPDIIKSFEDLGIPPILKDLCLRNRGLILLTGPTGSGKSTTLATMVDHINENRSCHIITIEDPVEYFHSSNSSLINQRELGANTHSFSNALRAALREDPDVILVGEMRDLETTSLSLTAAETGHLVMSTLHTSSAVKAIDRVIDIYPEGQKTQVRSMMSESLVAVIAQKLLPTRDGKGRVPACEVMIATTAIRNLIREDRIYQIPSLMQSGGVEGMQTLDQELQRLLSQGVIDRATAEAVADNPKLFKSNVL